MICDTMEPMHSVNRDSLKFSRLVRSVIRASSVLCWVARSDHKQR